MCKIGKNIKLCSCLPNGDIKAIVHNKKSRKHKIDRDQHTWALERYIGDSEYFMDGMLIFPSKMLVENLTEEFMLKELNSRNCFDFEYLPIEGVNLKIYNPKKYINEYLSFIFRNGSWIAESYDGFRDKTEKINYGKLIFE